MLAAAAGAETLETTRASLDIPASIITFHDGAQVTPKLGPRGMNNSGVSYRAVTYRRKDYTVESMRRICNVDLKVTGQPRIRVQPHF